MHEQGAVGPGSYHTTVDHAAVSNHNYTCSTVSSCDQGIFHYVQLASQLPGSHIEPATRASVPVMDNPEMSDRDDLSMASEIVIDLAIELEDTSIIPMSRDWELETDVPPFPVMVVLEVDVAVEILCFCGRSPRCSH